MIFEAKGFSKSFAFRLKLTFLPIYDEIVEQSSYFSLVMAISLEENWIQTSYSSFKNWPCIAFSIGEGG